MLEWLDITRYLGLPENVSLHGVEIDGMIVWMHWLMLIIFLIWAPYFLFVLYRFRQSRNPKADYHGVHSHLSTYHEVGVVVVELVLLFGLAVPVWAELRDDFPVEEEATVIHVVAEQFAWNIHYPGPDGIFGRRDIGLVNAQTNPLGLDRSDPDAADDIVSLNELRFPVDKPVVIHLTSKDVIHSFALNVMRVKQDAIPGLSIPIWFVPTQTGEWEISCAQLCGVGHYRMRGYFTVETQEEFDEWIRSQNDPDGAA